MMNKVAKLVSRNVKPVHSHDCAACSFLGRLNGKDLYHCSLHGEYVARNSSEPHDYGALPVDLVPDGSPYSLAHALLARRNAVSASFARFKAPHAWRSA